MMKYKNKIAQFLIKSNAHTAHPKKQSSRYENGVTTIESMHTYSFFLKTVLPHFLFHLCIIKIKNISMKCMITKKSWSRVITVIEEKNNNK